ncbi:hypothetical protein [Rubricoccus marinus]|uniref:TolC family protein n=1 Tax=Rubricoccus marinus TaxID=716817 RepID=A0A259TUC9_9BACT|nr:hypothetical protein [Rubricoccus marinus]OZC01382.1 hypothetical protein BSZ36_16980 [Rubricoccus marinus]
MRRLTDPPGDEPNARGLLRSAAALFAFAALLILPSRAALAQDFPGTGLTQDDPITALSLLADTSDAGLRVERARLDLAQSELRAVTGWRRWRPAADFFVSMSTRGLAFPSISSQGYDPAYAAIARWPGDTWGVTLSWSIDQVLDRRPVDRARNAVAVAEARIDAYQARREQQQARDRERVLARAQREADRQERQAQAQRRADLVAAQLRIEAGFLARHLSAQRELLRLAEMKYEQSEIDYEALARSRLAVLSAEHACATVAARLATLSASGDPALALQAGAPPEHHAPDSGIPPIPHP